MFSAARTRTSATHKRQPHLEYQSSSATKNLFQNLREVSTAALDINNDGFWVLKSTGRGLDNPPAAAADGDDGVDAPVHALETGLLF